MTEEQHGLGPRLLAFAALWSLLSGLLLVLSFVAVALVAFAALFAVMLVVGGKWLLARVSIGEWLSAALTAAGQPAARATRRLRGVSVRPRVRRIGNSLSGVGVRPRVRRLGNSLRKSAAGTPRRANAFLARALRVYAIAVYRLKIQTAHLVDAGRRSQAVRLNKLGAQLRRRGAHEQAAEQHRVALAIARDLGDEKAEALTLNNLALALAQGGAQGEAIQHLEQAATVLRRLGDEEHEGHVIANLGIVYRRQGDSEQAVQFLHQALDKLPPESSTYRKVEEELGRAS